MHGIAYLPGGRSHMMATAAVIGLSGGKRLLSSTFYYSDLTEKLSCYNMNDNVQQLPSTKNVITAKKSSDYSPSCFSSNQHMQPIKALKEHVDTSASIAEPWFELEEEVENKLSVEALLLLQKSLLEKQWNLSLEHKMLIRERERGREKPCNKNIGGVTCSGVSARQRRTNNSRRARKQHPSSIVSPELLQIRLRGYVKGLISEELLTHAQVVRLSKKIKTGLSLEEHKSRLEERLGHEPSDEQLAMSLRISRAQLQSKQIECTLAREKLAMSNVRLVMSIAQRYDNMGAEMADLIQGGLIGLLRGIEKFDSSKGFKISTYVYWWIRQGVSRALVENSRTLRLPTHLHERLSLIRKAKTRLEQKGITPSIDRIAECLNMSEKKVRNAMEAVNKVISLDKEAFPSLNGLPGETLHSYVADNRLENNPWHGVDEWALKDEVKKLINSTVGEREREIIRLYYGMDNECLTWEDISRRIGLSRERVRQVGLVALEKLKHAARNRMLDAMLLKH